MPSHQTPIRILASLAAVGTAACLRATPRAVRKPAPKIRSGATDPLLETTPIRKTVMNKETKHLSLAFGLAALLLFPQIGRCFYNPSIGRWLSRDPLQEKGGLNLYANVGNNPINSVDPDGRGVVDCVKAMAELNAAMANLAARIAKAGIYGLDPGHLKALEQATTRCQNALDRVKKHCGCVVGAALIATEATALIEAAIAIIDAAAVVIIVL